MQARCAFDSVLEACLQPTAIDFKGTPLLPRAKGHASVETKRGFSEIDARFSELEPAAKFGPEYLTFVM